MLIKLLRIVLALCATVATGASASLDISLEKQCFGGSSRTVFFTKASITSDYTVKIGSSIYPYDISFEIVEKRHDADLVFMENTFTDESTRFSKSSDMKICKKLSPVGAEVIKLSTVERNPYVSIKISKYVLNKDYKIFVKSERVSPHQAAAYFGVLWKKDREHFLSLLE